VDRDLVPTLNDVIGRERTTRLTRAEMSVFLRRAGCTCRRERPILAYLGPLWAGLRSRVVQFHNPGPLQMRTTSMTERESPGGGPSAASDASAVMPHGDRAEPLGGPTLVRQAWLPWMFWQLLLLGVLLAAGIYLTWENLRAVTE
jgi:hypothetical protein